MPSLNGALPSYGELVGILEKLPLLLREARRARRLSLRAASAEIGTSFNTLCRIENGTSSCDLTNAVAILRWLDRSGETT